jgi:hypothetical protein
MSSHIVTKDDKDRQRQKKEIIKTWLTGKCSCTLIIPRSLAKECDMDEPGHVIVEKVENGILIRKLEV